MQSERQKFAFSFWMMISVRAMRTCTLSCPSMPVLSRNIWATYGPYIGTRFATYGEENASEGTTYGQHTYGLLKHMGSFLNTLYFKQIFGVVLFSVISVVICFTEIKKTPKWEEYMEYPRQHPWIPKFKLNRTLRAEILTHQKFAKLQHGSISSETYGASCERPFIDWPSFCQCLQQVNKIFVSTGMICALRFADVLVGGVHCSN